MRLLKPTPRMQPDEWGADNRVYPPSSGHPGPRDPKLTPYGIPFGRAVASGKYSRAVGVFGAQMGKTDTCLDIIGERLDTSPVPMIYLGPSEEFNKTQFEPRLMTLLDESESLASKVARGKRMTKTLKRIAGVTLRLAHGGSSTALKSDPAAIGIADEVDELLGNIGNRGNPLVLLEARGFTYADFVLIEVSTPSVGAVDTEIDEATGLEFWSPAPPEDLDSTIWRHWQEGTRHHWAWPCPHCREFFIPRFKTLWWPEGATPAEARREARLICPRCEQKIDPSHKSRMNAAGVAIAPGQRIECGEVVGDEPDNNTYSIWASGLASPFVEWGKRAEDYLKQKITGDQDEIQTAINAGFGEVYAPGGGDVPEWQEVASRKLALPARTVLPQARFLTCAVDVQRSRLVYSVRAWGPRAESWLVDHGELFGEPVNPNIWNEQLIPVLYDVYDGHQIKQALIDSGNKPGSDFNAPVNRIYEFCRQHRTLVRPSKGFKTLQKPVIVSDPEVNNRGEVSKWGLNLVRLDTDYFKRWVHERVRWPDGAPGAWHLHGETTDDYCRQIVAEARLITSSGAPNWVRRSRENHYLDVEAMNAALAWMLGAHRMPTAAEIEPVRQSNPQSEQKKPRRDSWINGGGATGGFIR